MSAGRVLTVGEALIDWVCTERGADLAEARGFTKAPGGAPMNVAVGLARLGVPTAFAGCVGDDPFGEALRRLMAEEGVDTGLVATAPGRQTRMAYVVTNAEGDRELAAFSRVGCADEALSPGHLPDAALDAAPAFYFGSLILQAEPARAAVLAAARRVHAGPGLVVFDPNIRPVLWPERGALRFALGEALAVTDVLKLGVDELPFVGVEGETDVGVRRLLAEHGLLAVVLTDGARGAGLYTRQAGIWMEGFPVEAVEATGAGDGFVAGLVAGMLALGDGELKARLAGLGTEEWMPILRHASAVGALATTRPGAITALPTASELAAFLKRRQA